LAVALWRKCDRNLEEQFSPARGNLRPVSLRL
jgi:hypothetical protein